VTSGAQRLVSIYRARVNGLLRWWRSRKADRFEYAPRRDGRPDVGEVCWSWVSFEDDPNQGKDRPILIVGKRGRAWLALMLTSKDRADHGAMHTDRFGRTWLDIGPGPWDRDRRPSEVRLDRLLVVRTVRREGAAVDRATYDRILTAARPLWR
jgi:hypothetical protein